MIDFLLKKEFFFFHDSIRGKKCILFGAFGAFSAFSSQERFCSISMTSFTLCFWFLWCFWYFFVVYDIVSCTYVVRCSSFVFLVLIVLYCCVHSVTNLCSRMSNPRAFGAFRAFCALWSQQRFFVI